VDDRVEQRVRDALPAPRPGAKRVRRRQERGRRKAILEVRHELRELTTVTSPSTSTGTSARLSTRRSCSATANALIGRATACNTIRTPRTDERLSQTDHQLRGALGSNESAARQRPA
jgi:hypothetical protein